MATQNAEAKGERYATTAASSVRRNDLVWATAGSGGPPAWYRVLRAARTTGPIYIELPGPLTLKLQPDRLVDVFRPYVVTPFATAVEQPPLRPAG